MGLILFLTALFCSFSDGEEVAQQPPEGEGAGNAQGGRARHKSAAKTRKATRRELDGAIEQREQNEWNQCGVIAQGACGIAREQGVEGALGATAWTAQPCQHLERAARIEAARRLDKHIQSGQRDNSCRADRYDNASTAQIFCRNAVPKNRKK